jgi:hypothetical protein
MVGEKETPIETIKESESDQYIENLKKALLDIAEGTYSAPEEMIGILYQLDQLDNLKLFNDDDKSSTPSESLD